ncbi:hypothetical protein TRFO_39416 [Tritrichomonas foetus]|uniref:Sulfatase N-terminal domain-containing protein n=1 Tax=Tritrichomonas foetus TaxID=1144522 RepID=A0A1J4JAW9_9EUKA|nr:hypothetical protein TRFO_39416 [Tritrichomonas foetus]|eukprot:OHS94404.1 hypothetical protein TRFO_39416 [Tritrichomonas foetus]
MLILINWFNNEKIIDKAHMIQVDIFRLFFRFLFSLAIELYKKLCCSQLKSRTIINIKAHFLIQTAAEFSGDFIAAFMFLLSYAFETAEAAAFTFMFQPITKQSLNQLNISYILEDHIEFLYITIFFVFLSYPLIKLPLLKVLITLPNISIILWFFALAYSFSYLNIIVGDFTDEYSNTMFNSHSSELSNNLFKASRAKIEINKTRPLKNLILFQAESLAYGIIDPITTPYIYSLSEKYEIIRDIKSVPYSTWSSAATILTQCGIPEIIHRSDWGTRKKQTINHFVQLKCISDYLAALHYNITSGYGGWSTEKVSGMGDFRRAKKYIPVIGQIHDPNAAQFYADRYLEKLDHEYKTKGTNFLSWFFTSETHIPFPVPKWCHPDKGLNTTFKQSFNCGDKVIKIFIEKFLELKMHEHTVLVLFPDHFPHGIKPTDPYFTLFVLFPGMEKIPQKANKSFTYYDFAPTIMKLIGIDEYSPGFPFGRDYYDPSSIEHIPSSEELGILYSFYNEAFRRNEKHDTFICKRADGESYESNEPCKSTNYLSYIL